MQHNLIYAKLRRKIWRRSDDEQGCRPTHGTVGLWIIKAEMFAHSHSFIAAVAASLITSLLVSSHLHQQGCLSLAGRARRRPVTKPSTESCRQTACKRHQHHKKHQIDIDRNRRCPEESCVLSFRLTWNALILWRPLLPYGYSYQASCARLG